MNKTYSELIKLKTFEERFEYLKLEGKVGEDTFGWDRYLNQQLYRSKEWKRFRDEMIVRDNGCDLGAEGYETMGRRIILHHLNPITKEDILYKRDCLFDPENVICTTHKTHNAIHYGSSDILPKGPVERAKNDTCPWRR